LTQSDFSQRHIPGLTYLPAFISEEVEYALLQSIDRQLWLNDLKRRVQHYGYKYDYKARSVSQDMALGPFPNWLDKFVCNYFPCDEFRENPDQVIVNEYKPGQGISAHIDCVPCFAGTIASLSLGASATMVFQRAGNSRQEIYLKPRSLIVLSGPARYDWTHAIPARKSDLVDKRRVPRDRRVSLTFRRVIAV
jgi:alkylated DNA repair dioxygenase AlkB